MNTKRTMVAGAVALALSIGSLATMAAPQGSSGATSSMSGSSAAGAAGAASGAQGSSAPSSMRGSDSSGASTRGTETASSGSSQIAAADRKFINDAASAGMFEVQAAQLAQSRAQDSSNKTYAQQMIADHEKNNRQLMQLAQSKGVSPPTKLDAKHQAMLSKLQKAEGANFDREFGKAMDQSHSEAVQMFERGEKQVKDTELKSYISQTLPTLQQHHQQAASLPGAKGGASRQAEAGRSGSYGDRSSSGSSSRPEYPSSTGSSSGKEMDSKDMSKDSGNPDTSTTPKR